MSNIIHIADHHYNLYYIKVETAFQVLYIMVIHKEKNLHLYLQEMLPRSEYTVLQTLGSGLKKDMEKLFKSYAAPCQQYTINFKFKDRHPYHSGIFTADVLNLDR